MNVRIFYLVFVLAAILAMPQVWAKSDPDLHLTWDTAEIWVKLDGGSLINSHMNDTRLKVRLDTASRKLPTVIFFHDCGKNRKLAGWHYARFLARAGFAVILPSSFARSERPETCSYWQFLPLDGAPIEEVHALRKAEISHALKAVRNLNWVDTNNLFLMGQGEGADALAAFDGTGYSARVLSGALCQWGVAGRPDSPLMIVASRDDRLFNGADAGACAAKARTPDVQLKLFPGYQHDTSSLPEARTAVIDFLTRLLQK